LAAAFIAFLVAFPVSIVVKTFFVIFCCRLLTNEVNTTGKSRIVPEDFDEEVTGDMEGLNNEMNSSLWPRFDIGTGLIEIAQTNSGFQNEVNHRTEVVKSVTFFAQDAFPFSISAETPSVKVHDDLRLDEQAILEKLQALEPEITQAIVNNERQLVDKQLACEERRQLALLKAQKASISISTTPSHVTTNFDDLIQEEKLRFRQVVVAMEEKSNQPTVRKYNKIDFCSCAFFNFI
jgi:hypothetical protein